MRPYNEWTKFTMKLQYTFTRQFFLRGIRPRTLQRGYPPSALPHVEECTYIWGVNTSWGIDTAEREGPLHQEDNQAPQPTERSYSLNVKVTLAFKERNLDAPSNLSSTLNGVVAIPKT